MNVVANKIRPLGEAICRDVVVKAENNEVVKRFLRVMMDAENARSFGSVQIEND